MNNASRLRQPQTGVCFHFSLFTQTRDIHSHPFDLTQLNRVVECFYMRMFSYIYKYVGMYAYIYNVPLCCFHMKRYINISNSGKHCTSGLYSSLVYGWIYIYIYITCRYLQKIHYQSTGKAEVERQLIRQCRDRMTFNFISTIF